MVQEQKAEIEKLSGENRELRETIRGKSSGHVESVS